MRNISEKLVEKIKKIYFLLTIFFPKIVQFAISGKNIVEPNRTQMIIWRLRIACWITKASSTYSDYVILFAFPLQQWLRGAPKHYAIRALPVSFPTALLQNISKLLLLFSKISFKIALCPVVLGG
jgi:hypothetical protein